MEALVTAANRRRVSTDPIYAPLTPPPPGEDDTTIELFSTVGAVVSTSLHEPDSVPAYWGTRVEHTIHIYPSEQATVSQIHATLEAATVAARLHDLRLRARLADAGSQMPPDNDRRIVLSTPYLDMDLTGAAFQAGFRIRSASAWQRVSKLQQIARHRVGGCGSGLPQGWQLRALTEADEDAVVAAITALNDVDAGCMNPRPVRPQEEETTRIYARIAIAAGPGWSTLATREEDDDVALLALYPPQQSEWAATGLNLKAVSYLGLAYTPAQWRGQGIMNQMLARSWDHAAACGAENVVLDYAFHNPLSSRYWMASGFQPVRALWVKAVTPE